MLLIPKSKTKIGLIQTLHLKGVTRAISTNYNDRRKEYPINYTSTDRWCSYPTGEYDPEVWGIVFDHMIYITNYTLLSGQEPKNITVTIEDNIVEVTRPDDQNFNKGLHVGHSQ